MTFNKDSFYQFHTKKTSQKVFFETFLLSGFVQPKIFIKVFMAIAIQILRLKNL